MVTSEAGGRSMRHASPGVPVCRATTSGDRGALGDAGRRHLGIEEHLTATCPTCGAADANTRHARLCHRAGAQVNEHQPLVHATSLFLKRMSVRHQVASGAPFNADRDLRMDVIIERRGLRDASASKFRHENILIDVIYADPQAGVHLRVETADQDGSAASTSEARKRNH